MEFSPGLSRVGHSQVETVRGVRNSRVYGNKNVKPYIRYSAATALLDLA